MHIIPAIPPVRFAPRTPVASCFRSERFRFLIFFLVQNLQRAGRDLTTAVPETFRWSMVEGRRVRGWVVAVGTLLNDTAHQDR
jgi:hypothetical protein